MTQVVQQRVLLIDDDQKLTDLMSEYLVSFGFEVVAEHCGERGAARALAEPWDAIVLDLMLPKIDGFEVLRRIRRSSQVPVLMLTARGDESDRVNGLDSGADDYVPKTASARELLARLRAVLRRVAVPHDTPREQDHVVGDLRILVDTRSVLVRGERVVLTPVEFDLLLSLARSVGKVKSRDDLLDETRGRSYEIFDRSIDVHISSLRRKIGDDPRTPRYILTIRTVGYMLQQPDAGTSS
jgi:DNA-binding response OmpR family regulator